MHEDPGVVIIGPPSRHAPDLQCRSGTPPPAHGVLYPFSVYTTAVAQDVDELTAAFGGAPRLSKGAPKSTSAAAVQRRQRRRRDPVVRESQSGSYGILRKCKGRGENITTDQLTFALRPRVAEISLPILATNEKRFRIGVRQAGSA